MDEQAIEQAGRKVAHLDPPAPPPQFLDQLKTHGHWNVIEGEDP